MKLRILNVLTKTAPTIPQTPHTDLKYPYVPKMAIRTHCALPWQHSTSEVHEEDPGEEHEESQDHSPRNGTSAKPVTKEKEEKLGEKEEKDESML